MQSKASCLDSHFQIMQVCTMMHLAAIRARTNHLEMHYTGKLLADYLLVKRHPAAASLLNVVHVLHLGRVLSGRVMPGCNLYYLQVACTLPYAKYKCGSITVGRLIRLHCILFKLLKESQP